MNNKRKVLGLIRVSTDQQDTERQKTDLERVSRTHGLTIERTLPLDGVSGRKVRLNPEVNQLLAELKRPDISGVAISALDRLFRPDRYEDFGILDRFRDAGKLIFSAKEGVLDPATDMGFLMSLMSGAFAGHEWRTLRQRTQSGKAEKRLLGRNLSGSESLPRGILYQRITDAGGKTIDGKWSYDAAEVAKIREAYRILFADHNISLSALAARVGWKWGGALRRCLQNPVWRGVRIGAPMAGETEPVEIPLPLKPVLTPDQWALAQTLLAKRRTWSKATRTQRFLGTGLLVCDCGQPYYMHGDLRRGQRDQYYCASRFKGGPGCGAARLRRDIVDRVIEQIVSRHLTDAAVLAKGFARVKPEPQPDLLARERELAKLAARRQKWIDQYDEDRITKAEFEAKMDALKKATHEVEARMPVAPPPVIDQRAAVAGLVRWAVRFPKIADFERKRTELKRVIRRIPVTDGGIADVALCGAFLGELSHTNPEHPSRSRYWSQSPASGPPRPRR